MSPPFVYDVSAITEIEVEKLAYFAASILWRGSAHQWRFGKQLLTRISLGPYEEELRQYLLGQAQFPRNAVLAVDVIADAILRRGVIPPFGGKREGGIWSYALPFFGIVLTMVIGNTMSKSLRKHCTYPSERPFITRGMTKPETVLGWGMSLLSSSRTGGKLDRQS